MTDLDQNKLDELIFFKSIFMELPNGVIAIDDEGIVILINPSALEILGLEGSFEFYEGTSILSFLASRKLKNKITASLAFDITHFSYKALNIRKLFIDVNGKKLKDGLLINLEDVTQNILMREKATQALIFTQEADRKRFSQEMHDGIGPALSSIKLQIDAVNRKIVDPDLNERLHEINDLLSNVSSEIRQISHAIMPRSLVDFGIHSALSNLVKQLNDTEKMLVLFDSNINDVALNKNLELNLYRIVQELINNAIKHSNCTEIQIQLHRLEDRIQLSVYDNGIGMDKHASSDGIGMNNIYTRVKSLRGSFEIDSQPGHGFNANISIPLKRSK